MDFAADGVTASAATNKASTSTSLAAAEASINPPADTTGQLTNPDTTLSSSPAPPAAEPATPTADPFHLRAPHSHRAAATSTASGPAFTAPTTQWLAGTWHVTHSSLPLWKDKRNTRITYTALPDGNKLDDLVQYQTRASPKIKTIEGVDTPAADAAGGGAWRWRGKGWLRVATSDWELLGCGEAAGGEQWAVTYFAKTLFTPPGIDVYARAGAGLSAETLAGVKGALEVLGREHADIRVLVEDLYELHRDDSMETGK